MINICEFGHVDKGYWGNLDLVIPAITLDTTRYLNGEEFRTLRISFPTQFKIETSNVSFFLAFSLFGIGIRFMMRELYE